MSRISRESRPGAAFGAATGFLLFVALPLVGAGCTERQTVTGQGPLPVRATAYPTTDTGAVAKSPPQDVQELRVTIVGGRFDSDRYSAQSRSVRLVVTTNGGPHTLSIEGLLNPTELPVDGTTEIGLTLPNPGDYTMRLSGAAPATAILNVRPPGER